MASLKQVLDQYQLVVPEKAYPLLKRYCDYLWEINQQINLTRHTDYEKFVTRDLLDTLELSKLIPAGKEVLDVGSGGGVPGMVLAILRPDLKLTLSDSIGKKTSALNEIAEKLSLDVEIYQTRAEDLLEDFRFDYTTARGVGSLLKIGTWFKKVWPAAGKMLAFKGPNWIKEKAVADENGLFKRCDIRVVAEYPVPGCDWSSVILQIKASR